MMIFLFSQSRAVLIALEALTLMFVMTRVYDGASALGALLVFVIGSIIAAAASAIYAGLLHHRFLLVLYSMQRPDDFIKYYEPLLLSKWIPSNVRFTLTAYLSNGYAAKGDFSRARKLLDDAPKISKRQQLSCDLILCANRASIALAEGAAEEAAAQLDRMEQLISSGNLNAKKRAAQETILKTQRAQLCILRGKCTMADCDILRDESRKPGSALRKTELNCFMGRAYAQLGQNPFAKEYLSAAAQSKETCWGKLAANALKSIRNDSAQK